MDTEQFLYIAGELLGASTATLGLTACVVPLAFGFGALASWARCSRHRIPQRLADLYVLIFRSTPMLVQLFVLYYGLSQFEMVRSSFVWPLLRNPYICAVFAMAIGSGAYVAEVIRGALGAVPKGTAEAGTSLGLTRVKTFFLITLPIAARSAIPASSSEIVITIKATSLASTVTIMELTGTARDLMSETYDVIEVFVMVSAIYLILNAVIMLLFRTVEARFSIPGLAA
ncbi:ABC transporter permease [Rhizobium sp. BR 314]|uniref:ABC transporter permease n=1 Tax=Rhizobium sp. BR 314 TaxID=3040013 RepID=UPI0039C00101